MSKLDSQPPISFDSGIHFDEAAPRAIPKTRMNKILRHWLRLSRPDRVDFFRTVADSLAKTPAPLANPNPPLVDYEAAVAAAEAKLTQVGETEQALKTARLELVSLIDAASEATEKMARRTEDAAEGDAAKMTPVGFQIVGAPQNTGPMTMPTDFELSMNDNEGAIDWQCHPVNGAKSYETRSTATPNDASSWSTHTAVTRSSGSITGLPSGVRRYVQVRAIGTEGPGPWSDVATKMVP